MDCTVEQAICQANGVRGYPTLLFFKDGASEGVKYAGGRDLASLKSYVNTHTGAKDL